MYDFSGKHFVITGGTSGIGLSTAKAIVEQGGFVTVTGRDLERIAHTQTLLKESSRAVKNDASLLDTGQSLLEALGNTPKIDGLFLNAAIADIGTIQDIDPSHYHSIMDTNVRGPFLQISALSHCLKDKASVVVTSSSSIYEGAAMTSVYAASKGAVSAAVRSWARELAPRGIRVNSLCPGPIQSNLRSFLPDETRESFEKSVVSQVPLGRIASAEEAAAVALFLLSENASYVTGSEYAVDGGLIMR